MKTFAMWRGLVEDELTMAAIKIASPDSAQRRGYKRTAFPSPSARVEKLHPKGEFWTDDELLALGASDDLKHELWNGKIITMPPAGAQHGDIISRLSASIAIHVYEHRLGRVYDGQTGFRLSTDYCLAPDVSFVSKERLRLILPIEDKLFHGAPDLAVEVLSPSDSITATEKKITRCLVHGTRLGWIVDPKSKTVRVYRQVGKFELVRSDRALTGNTVLPGFKLTLAKLFEAALSE